MATLEQLQAELNKVNGTLDATIKRSEQLRASLTEAMTPEALNNIAATLDRLIAAMTRLEGKRISLGQVIAGGGAGEWVHGGAEPNRAPGTPPNPDAANKAAQELKNLETHLESVGAGLKGPNANLRTGLMNAIKAIKETGVTLDSLKLVGEQSKGMGQFRLTGYMPGTDINTKMNFTRFVDDMGRFGKTARELQNIQFKADTNNRELFRLASAYGFKEDDLKRVRAEGAGGYRLAEFQRSEGSVDYLQRFRINQQNQPSLAPVGRQFQTFGQGIGRDIVELAKWSIAISAIYAPINALSDAMTQLIENQAKLADASIAVNESVANTSEIFNDVYKSAQGAGESVGGVIDAFGQAYRAAGRISNETERYQTSVKLLNDSLVLSKISTLDQAQAIDTLTAALYQSGNAEQTNAEKLSQGTKLLDEWVRVSKVANVDVATLATGVAVLGDSAETAGLSVEQLNAMIATIAETSIAGGKESANIAKALIGNFQQESAVKELNRLGIAVIDATGKTRQFLDVMNDVAALREKKLLGDEDFQRLTLALGGGGIRRQKDVSAFIENFGRMQQIVELQADSSGEAATALAKKLDTVQTAATQLTNAFTGLAQSLGDEGGLLTLFSTILKTATSLVEVLDKIISAAGKASPLLLGLGTAALALKLTGSDWRTFIGNNIAPSVAAMGGGTTRQQMRNQRGITDFLSGRDASGRLTNGAYLGGFAAAALPAMGNFMEGNTAEGVGNLIGGAIGATLGGPMGALAGSAIAEAFVRTTMTYDKSLADFFAGSVSDGITKGSSSAQATESTTDLITRAYREIGGGSEEFGSFRAWYKQQASKATLGERMLGRQVGDITDRTRYGATYATPGAAALDILKKSNPEVYAQLKAQAAAEGAAFGVGGTPISKAQARISTPETIARLTEYQQQRQGEIRTQLITGEIKPSEYARQMQYLSAYTVTATRYMAALGDEVSQLGPAFGDDSGAYQSFLEILSSGNEELINQINAQVAGIDYLQNLWESWNPSEKTAPFKNPLTGEKVTGTREDVMKMIEDLQASLANTVQFGAQQAKLQNLKVPEVYGSYITPMPQQDLATVIKQTTSVQDRRYSELKKDDYEALKDSFETFSVLVKDSGKIFYEKVTGIDQKIFQEMFQKLQKEGTITGAETGGPGFQFMDITRSVLEQAVAQANALAISMQNNPKLGYQPNFEDVIVATNDEQISKQHVDMKLLQYILQQILDTEKKQLEGMYNIPEGATFWVPLTAAWLADRSGGGTGGLSDIVNPQTPTTGGGEVDAASNMRKVTNEMILAKKHSDFSKPYYQIEPLTYGETYRGQPRRGSSFAEATEPMSIFQKMIQTLQGLGPAMESILNGLHNRYILPEDLKDTKGAGGIGSAIKGADGVSAVTKFDIKFTSTTQLIVDGRVLAEIIKPYLASDLSKTNESSGTVSRQYVI